MLKWIFSICLSACSVLPMAQEAEAILALLDYSQREDKIEVTVAIRGGASCQGVQLERRTENSDFEVIDTYPGICGGTEFTEYYYLTDSDPLTGQWTYYRLLLGQVGTTRETAILFVPIGDSGLALFPNPASEVLFVRVLNPDNQQKNYRVFDSYGKLRMEGEFRTSSNEIDVRNLNSGFYVLKVSGSSGPTFQNRFVVE